jgi:hypothetical protein
MSSRIVVGQEVPPSSAFPSPPGSLASARDSVDVPAMRRHMWDIFAMVTAPGSNSDPWWRTWRRACTAYQNCKNIEGFQVPSQLLFALSSLDAKGLKLSDVANFPPEIIFYNDAAFQHVTREFHYRADDPGVPLCLTPLDFSLASRKVTDSLIYLRGKFSDCTQPGDLPNGLADRAIPEFPANSIALKTAWQVVTTAEDTKLTIWDVAAGKPSHDVSISAASASPQGGRACPNLDSSRPVPLDCFYHFQLGSAADILSAKPFLRNVKATDYAVLVGMHVMTKELPDWTWATFWWDDHSDVGRFAEQRTAGVTGVWRNYLMNSTFSQITPRAPSGAINTCFNPYLEGKAPDGPQSNCVRCHRMAARPQLMIVSPPRPVSAFDAFFQSELKTDYAWSVSIEPDRILNMFLTEQQPPAPPRQ